MKKKYIQAIACCIIMIGTINAVFSQTEDSLSYQQLHMFRIKQENDLYQYWYQSDKDFTNGIHFELVHPVFKNKAANWFLIGFKNTLYNDFSLSIGQDIYTPSNTQTTTIDSTDRPYSATLYFTYSKYSNQLYKGRQLFSNFYFGLSGNGAYGEESQNGVHEIFGNKSAKGWGNQVSTGLMIDYDLTYSQLLPLGNKFCETSYFAKIHVGTIFDYTAAGILFKIGHYSDSYINENGIYNKRNKVYFNEKTFGELNTAKLNLIPRAVRRKSITEQIAYLNKRMNRKLQYFITLQLETSYILYDGTAQGSMIQFSEPTYTLKTENTQELTLQGAYGINFQYGPFYLNISRYLANSSYDKGDLFGFGEIQLSLVF